jgi:hypothetical protein
MFYAGGVANDQWHALKVETKGGQTLRVPKGYFP